MDSRDFMEEDNYDGFSPMDEDPSEAVVEVVGPVPDLNNSFERVNPFEKYNLQNMQNSVWSPSVFANVNVDQPSPVTQGWNIDQMARLFPKPLDQSPSSHQNEVILDPATKAKVQADIDKFFKKSPIVPSPPRDDQICINRSQALQETPRRPSSLVRRPSLISRAETWTQTSIQFPPVLPLMMQEALEKYMTTDVESASQICTPTVRGEYPVRPRALSFGDFEEEEERPKYIPFPGFESPTRDPFGSNHIVGSPTFASPGLVDNEGGRFRRSEFTPTGQSTMDIDNLTPILARDGNNNDTRPSESSGSAGTPFSAFNCQRMPTTDSDSKKTAARARQRRISVANKENDDGKSLLGRRSSESVRDDETTPPPSKCSRSPWQL